MESHNYPGTHGKKKWKTYIWEFLMLFLAVFCGFLAENLREENGEHQRERQFMASMLKDLRSDSIQLERILKDSVRVKKMDSLLTLLQVNDINKMDVDAIYRLNFDYALNRETMFFTRNTITQLKSGGNMRLIRNEIVVDSINAFDNLMAGVDVQSDIVDKMYFATINIEKKIFDMNYFRKNEKPAFITDDIKLMKECANDIAFQIATLKNYNYMLESDYRRSANNLMNLLRKEYEIK